MISDKKSVTTAPAADTPITPYKLFIAAAVLYIISDIISLWIFNLIDSYSWPITKYVAVIIDIVALAELAGYSKMYKKPLVLAVVSFPLMMPVPFLGILTMPFMGVIGRMQQDTVELWGIAAIAVICTASAITFSLVAKLTTKANAELIEGDIDPKERGWRKFGRRYFPFLLIAELVPPIMIASATFEKMTGMEEFILPFILSVPANVIARIIMLFFHFVLIMLCLETLTFIKEAAEGTNTSASDEKDTDDEADTQI
ncbi:MAG: hypothetical protein IJ305_00380 [Oscillospiraceae bacterium]|nr:hypothetical protein [Oscillospiraceae bacterium]